MLLCLCVSAGVCEKDAEHILASMCSCMCRHWTSNHESMCGCVWVCVVMCVWRSDAVVDPRHNLFEHTFIWQTHTACTDKELCVRGRPACVWCQWETEKGRASYRVYLCAWVCPLTLGGCSLTPLITEDCCGDGSEVKSRGEKFVRIWE